MVIIDSIFHRNLLIRQEEIVEAAKAMALARVQSSNAVAARALRILGHGA